VTEKPTTAQIILEKVNESLIMIGRIDERLKGVESDMKLKDCSDEHVSKFMSRLEALSESMEKRITKLEKIQERQSELKQSINVKAWFAIAAGVMAIVVAFFKDKFI